MADRDEAGRRIARGLSFLPLAGGLGFVAGVTAVRTRVRIRKGW